MVQRRGGSDDWEHEFQGIREKNDKPSALDVREGVIRRTWTKTSTFNALSKASTSGDKEIYTNEITFTQKWEINVVMNNVAVSQLAILTSKHIFITHHLLAPILLLSLQTRRSVASSHLSLHCFPASSCFFIQQNSL